MKKLRWGIISTAKIGREKVIPAIQRSELGTVVAIASSNHQLRAETASRLNIPVQYESYEDLLADQEIDAVYIPLPNHLHLPWIVKSAQAGRHVLCEKPLTLNAAALQELQDQLAAYPGVKVMEAFMYRFHPQWEAVKDMVMHDEIGELRQVQSFFSYFNIDAQNIRNKPEAGGGALMDIGCYCISFARWLFEAEPRRVSALMDIDPDFGTDRMTSAMLEFEKGSSSFTCSTQLQPYQRVNILGTKGRIEVEIPVNAPPDQHMRVWLYKGVDKKEFQFDPVDQYSLQADAFARAVLEDKPVPTPLADALGNMRVIDAVVESARGGRWVAL